MKILILTEVIFILSVILIVKYFERRIIFIPYIPKKDIYTTLEICVLKLISAMGKAAISAKQFADAFKDFENLNKEGDR